MENPYRKQNDSDELQCALVYIQVGTSAGGDDVHAFQDVGLQTRVDRQRCSTVALGRSTSGADCVAMSIFGAPCVYTAADFDIDLDTRIITDIEEECAVDPTATALRTATAAPLAMAAGLDEGLLSVIVPLQSPLYGESL
jgi:hypothetical protein